MQIDTVYVILCSLWSVVSAERGDDDNVWIRREEESVLRSDETSAIVTPGPASDIVLLIKGYKSSWHLNLIWPVFFSQRAVENKQVHWQFVTFVKSTSPFHVASLRILNAQAYFFCGPGSKVQWELSSPLGWVQRLIWKWIEPVLFLC